MPKLAILGLWEIPVADHIGQVRCVCGGLNYGAGFPATLENTRRLRSEGGVSAHGEDAEILRVEIDLNAQGFALF